MCGLSLIVASGGYTPAVVHQLLSFWSMGFAGCVGGLGVAALSRLWAQQLWCIFSLFFSAESTVATLSLLVDFPDILILANNSTVQQRFYQ